MAQQIPVDRSAVANTSSDGGTHEVLPDLAYRRVAIANVVYFGGAAESERVLIDAGIRGSAMLIAGGAESRFEKGGRPDAIILTHGHFDHVGALSELAERWKVPIYAHPLETPHLDGSQSYPEPDPSVGGGIMARLASFYPRGPVNVTPWLSPLPADGSVPHMTGWSWIHTPGHTPGHISLWRESDRTLIVGDAFITTAQESAYAVLTQEPELHGPPMYYTPDWEAARESVERLAALQPETIITGHGPPMRGPLMRAALDKLANEFDRVAVPDTGKYVPRSPK